MVVLKRQNRFKVGTDKPKLKVKMQSVSDDNVYMRRPHAARVLIRWQHFFCVKRRHGGHLESMTSPEKCDFVMQLMRIHLKNNPAEFHPDHI